ncbi:MAG: hypothetical protein MPJ50_09120 [Pirellulales bacterium]|nr:hypothetical protein [Pirellulales bacterium]
MAQQSPRDTSPGAHSRLTPWVKLLISVGLVFHLFAVFLPPLAVIPSAATAPVRESIDWYTGPLRLQNGYRFFSPDPPDVSMVIRYEVELPNGEALSGIFPNKEDFWPRLYYHRYLMLSSRLQSLGYNSRDFGWGNNKPLRNDGTFGAWLMTARVRNGEFENVDEISDAEYAIDPPTDPNPLDLEPRDRLDARRYVESYAKHLRHKHNATRVRLYLLEHGVPPMQLFLDQGVSLVDPRSYRQSLLIDLPGEAS